MKFKLKKIIGKKAQEEMVGFMLIIILVIIGILFVLFIALRQPAGERESKEIGGFLHASMLYTTECRRDVLSFYNLEGLISACNFDNRQECFGNKAEENLEKKNVCEVLNQTFYDLIESAFVFSETSPYKGYSLVIMGKEEIIRLENKRLQGDSTGYTLALSGGFEEDIYISFKVFN